MSWDYRIARQICDKGKKYESFSYFIVEAYYDENNKVFMISDQAQSPYGENICELMENWVMFADAFNKPILDYDNIPEPGAKNIIENELNDLKDDLKNNAIEYLEKEGKISRFLIEDLITEEEYEQYKKDEDDKRKESEMKYYVDNVGTNIIDVIKKIIVKYFTPKKENK